MDREHPRLHCAAWVASGLAGTGNDVGVLTLREGRLSFVAQHGECFDVPLAEPITVSFPWYYFGAGLKLTADGRARRISFARPGRTPYPGPRLFAGLSPEERVGATPSLLDRIPVLGEIRAIRQGRRGGAVWRRALEGPRAQEATAR